jgi:hypothetical protein
MSAMLPRSPLPFTLPYDIGTDDIFAWRWRLELERRLRNITDAHREIIQHVADRAEAGDRQLTHAQIAAELNRGQKTVQDALRRARALGLLDWEAQYVPRPGSHLRWRTGNMYVRTTPQSFALPRPDVRRHDGGTPRRARKEGSIEAQQQGNPGEQRRRPAELRQPDLLAARREAMEASWRAANTT